MTVELREDLTTRVNAAACHGLLAWAERSGLIDDHRLASTLSKHQRIPQPGKSEALHAMTHWALACLGIRSDSRAFWAGWQGDSSVPIPSRDYGLGMLCRSAPSSLLPAHLTTQSGRQSAMYHCYQSLLLHPDQEREGGLESDVDSHVDDRSDDVNLSEEVYRRNFRQPLIGMLRQLVGHFNPEQLLTLIDVGAGSGGMLIDVGLSLRRLGQTVHLVAIDPSSIARECCRRRAAEASMPMNVFAGAIEQPLQIRQALIEAGVPMDQCLILAKAALHDRTLQAQSLFDTPLATDRPCLADLKVLCVDPIYRDHGWRTVDRLTIIHDMQSVLNQWHSVWTGCSLLVLESHLLPAPLVAKHLHALPLLPAYISHSLSAQYLLSSHDQWLAIQFSKFASTQFVPIHVFDDDVALMSISLLQS
jgi:hypothetical protein